MLNLRPLHIVAAVLLTAPAALPQDKQDEKAPIRVGIIGLDTSHVVAFTRVMNAPDATGALAQVRVTAAFPGGSDDIPTSRDRVAGYTRQVAEMGVEIVDSIDAVLERVDAVMLHSVDGRPHLEQVRPVIVARKPVFLDKPLAGSLADCLAIDAFARRHAVPWFSSSSLRFSPGIIGMRTEVGDVLGCDAFGPCHLEPHHPDLFWYGIHGVEILFTIMGPGCVSVTRTQTADFEQVTGTWSDGRIGTFRGIRRGKSGYGAMVFGSEGIERSGDYTGYEPLVVEIAEFFLTGESPVPTQETLEIYAFMEAADESLRRGGQPVKLADALAGEDLEISRDRDPAEGDKRR